MFIVRVWLVVWLHGLIVNSKIITNSFKCMNNRIWFNVLMLCFVHECNLDKTDISHVSTSVIHIRLLLHIVKSLNRSNKNELIFHVVGSLYLVAMWLVSIKSDKVENNGNIVSNLKDLLCMMSHVKLGERNLLWCIWRLCFIICMWLFYVVII